jgi:CO dehydrogenase maturation factor
LRDIIARITRNYDFVIIDNAAGMEHISRRTTRSLGSFVVVSDYSVFGVRSARRIYDLAKELDITIERAFLVLNKVTDSAEPLEREVEATGLSFAGTVPYSDEIVRMSVAGRPVFEMDDKRITGSVGRIAEKILNG